jgi:hypothetical protein
MVHRYIKFLFQMHHQHEVYGRLEFICGKPISGRQLVLIYMDKPSRLVIIASV